MLLIFQAMDAAGKDGAIKHVMSGVNPQGCQVTSFKAPSQEELDHDYLWRCLPRVARARPHRDLQPLVLRGGARRARAPELLSPQKLPPGLVTKHIWDERFEDIRAFERYLAATGRRPQVLPARLEGGAAKRFLERLDEPEKNWKFAAGDVASARTGTSTCGLRQK